ncbi:MAG: hypothetical protein ACXAEN_14560 [Candidatus Thorarchaeota archaeon]|jgi:hypothetical protein
MLKIRNFCSFNPEASQSVNPVEVLRDNFTRINTLLKYLKALRPEALDDYVLELQKLIRDDIQDYQIPQSILPLDEIAVDYQDLSSIPELVNLVFQVSFKYLDPGRSFQTGQEELQVPFLEWLKSNNVLRYYRTMALVEAVGRETGIKLWKELLYKATEDYLNEKDDEIYPSVREIIDGWVKAGEDADHSVEYTVVEYDDFKVALKFDVCPVFESVKHLEDREIAFLSYCWTGFPEEELNKRRIRKQTPQTLYQADYCIEIYWNNDKHPDAQPPSQEFWESLSE